MGELSRLRFNDLVGPLANLSRLTEDGRTRFLEMTRQKREQPDSEEDEKPEGLLPDELGRLLRKALGRDE